MTTFDRLKKLCDEQKMSIAELEERLDFGRNSLYGWKKKVPNGANLEKVADYFKVSVDYLLGRTEEKIFTSSLGEEDESNDPDIRTLQRAANKMTSEERKRAIKILGATFDDLFDDQD